MAQCVQLAGDQRSTQMLFFQVYLSLLVYYLRGCKREANQSHHRMLKKRNVKVCVMEPGIGKLYHGIWSFKMNSKLIKLAYSISKDTK